MSRTPSSSRGTREGNEPTSPLKRDGLIPIGCSRQKKSKPRLMQRSRERQRSSSESVAAVLDRKAQWADTAFAAFYERNKQLLPAWAVSSTVTGQQTELGVKHDKLQQVKAEREARAMMGQQDVKVDTTDAGESSCSCSRFQREYAFRLQH